MSYDISLVDRVTGEVVQLPFKHLMIGGTFAADYDPVEDRFTPKPISDAKLNITYNYSHYYYDATDGDPRFAHDEVSEYQTDGTQGPMQSEYGIRGIYGKSGAESIQMLKDMIERIEAKYKPDGKWIETARHRVKYFDNHDRELNIVDIIGRPEDSYTKSEYDETISEGPNTNYWEETAGNAIRPLWQLMTMAQLRPDGVWSGD
ncbi:MAG: hypothetical protein E7298_14355 [Lachnospiraceae bacterium]|nr:hypothetical protein [Lachnospiraceae bacterium]